MFSKIKKSRLAWPLVDYPFILKEKVVFLFIVYTSSDLFLSNIQSFHKKVVVQCSLQKQKGHLMFFFKRHYLRLKKKNNSTNQFMSFFWRRFSLAMISGSRNIIYNVWVWNFANFLRFKNTIPNNLLVLH